MHGRVIPTPVIPRHLAIQETSSDSFRTGSPGGGTRPRSTTGLDLPNPVGPFPSEQHLAFDIRQRVVDRASWSSAIARAI